MLKFKELTTSVSCGFISGKIEAIYTVFSDEYRVHWGHFAIVLENCRTETTMMFYTYVLYIQSINVTNECVLV